MIERRKTFKDAKAASTKRKTATDRVAVLPVTIENVSLAIRAVNRSAKRQRDGASASHAAGRHGLAGHYKRTKNKRYELKEFGIQFLMDKDALECVGKHGNMYLWKNEFCSVHSQVAPAQTVIETDIIFVEARKPGKSEMLIKDAEGLLQRVPRKINRKR